MGGERLREMAYEMEKEADAGDLDAVRASVAGLEASFLELSDAIKSHSHAA